MECPKLLKQNNKIVINDTLEAILRLRKKKCQLAEMNLDQRYSEQKYFHSMNCTTLHTVPQIKTF